jgi:hypothetical protein
MTSGLTEVASTGPVHSRMAGMTTPAVLKLRGGPKTRTEWQSSAASSRPNASLVRRQRRRPGRPPAADHLGRACREPMGASGHQAASGPPPDPASTTCSRRRCSASRSRWYSSGCAAISRRTAARQAWPARRSRLGSSSASRARSRRLRWRSTDRSDPARRGLGGGGGRRAGRRAAGSPCSSWTGGRRARTGEDRMGRASTTNVRRA